MTIEELKETLPVRKVLESYGLTFNHSGFSKCPFHEERHGSLKLYENTNSWYCFGCGVGGDIITFVKLYDNLDTKSAINQLCDDFRIGNSITYSAPRVKQPTPYEIKQEKIDSLIRKRKYWEQIREREIPTYSETVINFSELYAHACKILPQIDYELDVLMGIEYEGGDAYDR